MLEYKIVKFNMKVLPILGRDNWNLCSIYQDMMFFSREIPKERKARIITTGDDFEDFYRIYPRKIAKKDAQVMWSRLDEKDKTLAIEGLKRYILYWNKKGIEKQYLPHPATWINGKRWEDSLSETTPKLDIEEKYNKEKEEEKKLEQDRKWMESQISKLKASGKWDEWYNQAKEETPEAQRKFELLIVTRIKQRLSNNPL